MITPIDILHCAKNLLEEVGLDPNPCANDLNGWCQVVRDANTIIQSQWGGKDPSPFKQVAAISLAIVAKSPVPDSFPPGFVEEHFNRSQFAQTPSILRAQIAVTVSCLYLHKAKIGNVSHPSPDLAEPIEISDHFYKDLVVNLALSEGDDRLFGTIALIYEACAYQRNPEAQNSPRISPGDRGENGTPSSAVQFSAAQ